MQFRTPIEPISPSLQLTYRHRFLSMGSCFADRMGQLLAEARFDVATNPLGIAFQPLALARLLQYALEQQVPDPVFAPHLDMWHSFDLHSRFQAKGKAEYDAQLQTVLAETHDRLQSLDVLVVTFGTAWAYKHRDTGDWVNNNHRYPAATFEKKCLAVEEIVKEWRALLEQLRRLRPQLKVLLTVSPVRHTRDTLTGNGISKAILRVAAQQLADAHSEVHYFPAYEILMDDLRDYRFYEADMIHPTPTATRYIWNLFVEAHLSEQTQATLQQWQQLKRDLSHTPRQPGSSAHQAFLQRLLGRLQALSTELELGEYIESVQRQLHARTDEWSD